jgi:hypothetical protein
MFRRIAESAILALLILVGTAHLALAVCDHPRVDCPDPITVFGCDPEGGAIVDYPDRSGWTTAAAPVFLSSGRLRESSFRSGRTKFVGDPGKRGRRFRGCQFQIRVLRPRVEVDSRATSYVRSCDGEAVVVDYLPPTAMSECGPVPMSPEFGRGPGSLFPVGEDFVEWRTPTDFGRDYESVVIRIVVEVAEVTLTCPVGDIAVSGCPDGAIVDYRRRPPRTSAVPPRRTRRRPGAGARFPWGTTPVIWVSRYENTQEGYRSCGHRDGPAGDEPPVLTCPDEVVAAATPGPGSAVVEFDVTAPTTARGP